MSRLPVALVLIALGLAFPARAGAPAEDLEAAGDGGSSVGVLPLIAPDEIPLGERARLAKAVRVGLERGAVSPVDVTPPVECDAACLADVASNSSATHLVRVSFIKAGPDWVIRGEVFGSAGASQGVNEATCEICGTSELAGRVEDVSAGLATEIRLAGRLAELVLDGEPSGARVFVDGSEVGVTPYRGTFEPGEHEVILKKRGFGDQSIKWAGKQGVSEAINYSLGTDVAGADAGAKCDGGTPGRVDTRRAIAKPLGWMGIGTGIAALGTGVGLIAIHGRDHAQTCVPGFVDPEGDCPFTYQTVIPGAVLAGVGAGLIAGGVAAIVIANKKNKKSATARVGGGVGPRSVSLQVRF